ncbi:DUF7882 family protein [Agromyces binzhouensis]|uniref:DUF7882 domain-containing protein n=1 Tax=Agromyces binzhouensis TaxID=1817495 RepID=A0A4Q2JZ21_9MICO|nr:hypothetical protein [Agromyces binzhouensis]RXZ51528.1 hypothetical protein ESO86_02095 [Agromyces binzhouensis]
MGIIYYGFDSHRVVIDDRTLAHLELVIYSKLRRNERFALALTAPDSEGGIAHSLWMDSSIPLRFEYESEFHAAINRDWLEALSKTATSLRGLRIVDEPAPILIFPSATRVKKADEAVPAGHAAVKERVSA